MKREPIKLRQKAAIKSKFNFQLKTGLAKPERPEPFSEKKNSNVK